MEVGALKVEESASENRILTIPNSLSLFRLLLIPVFVILYQKQQSVAWAIFVLILSGLTDIADGWIARRFHMVSNIGKALDPVADKLTQIAVLFCLVSQHPVMKTALIVLIVKEIFVGIAALCSIQRSGEVHGAKWHGKITTALLYGTMILHLLWPDMPSGLSIGLVSVSVVMMLLSMVLYGIRYIRIIKTHANNQ